MQVAEYRTLHKEIKNKYREVEKKCRNEKCTEIDRISIKDKADAH